MDITLAAHIGGGAVGLLMGAVAISTLKGAALHKQTGYVFVSAMLVMALFGSVLSVLEGKPFDVLSSCLTCYMVLTGALAFRSLRLPIIVGLMCFGSGCLLGYISIEVYGLISGVRSTDAPKGAGYVFAIVLALALHGDFRVARPSVSNINKRIRHLWRMNFGLLLATVSFFGARPHLFPEWMQTSGLLLALAFSPVFVMAYWRLKLSIGMKGRVNS